MARTPFDPEADAIVHSERRWPMTVHLELLLEKPLDRERLVAALERAMARHPMTTVRRAPFRPWTRSFTWEVMSPRADHAVSVAPRHCDLRDLRDHWLSQPVSLDIAPPFRLLIVALETGGCALLFRAHHAAFDGVGASVFLRAAIAEYASAQDPPDRPPLDPATPPSRLSGGARTVRPAPRRFTSRVATVARAVRPIVTAQRAARLLPLEPVPVGPDYVVLLDRLDADATSLLRGGRIAKLVPSATLNDLLLAALHQTLGRWCEQRSTTPHLITVTMPVKRLDHENRGRGVDNDTLQAVTSTHATERVSAESTLRRITQQTRAIKEEGTSASPGGALGEVTILPVAVRAGVPRLMSWLTRDRFLDTMRLSNLGPIQMSFVRGGGPEISGVWFTPPARPPQSLNIGVVQHQAALYLGYRACSGPWTRALVTTFADAYRTTLSTYC